MKLFGREPILWLKLVEAIIACAIVFGLPITDKQKVELFALLTMALTFVARGQVFAQPETVAQVKSYIEAAPPAVADKAVAQVSATNNP